MAGSFQQPAAQVYLRDAGLTFNAEHVDVLHYDHALQRLMAVRRQSIRIYNVPGTADASQVRKHELSCKQRSSPWVTVSRKADMQARHSAHTSMLLLVICKAGAVAKPVCFNCDGRIWNRGHLCRSPANDLKPRLSSM